MKIVISGTLFNVSFPELTTHNDTNRVVQCQVKDTRDNRVIFQKVAVCQSKDFKKTDYEKITLRKVLDKYYPYTEGNKNSTKLSRREIWHDYLVSSASRRKLISQKFVEEINSKYSNTQTH